MEDVGRARFHAGRRSMTTPLCPHCNTPMRAWKILGRYVVGTGLECLSCEFEQDEKIEAVGG
jgi:hypothetical protein